ncbi:MAG TPA: DUF420 domain-containing protein [Bacteroidetes bacterium]|nr:DUF420 domain-containing protein [Bacteroidota bacterium]
MKLINTVSIAIPVIVILLLQIHLPGDFSYLPHIYAPINGVVSILLISAIIAIKNKKVLLHKRLIQFAIFLSIVFLIMYILYHGTTKETMYQGTGIIKYVYYIVLSSHILLSIFTIPLVLRAYYYAHNKDFAKHKKIAKFAFPLWLYVAITGVVVYLMISPYYPK